MSHIYLNFLWLCVQNNIKNKILLSESNFHSQLQSKTKKVSCLFYIMNLNCSPMCGFLEYDWTNISNLEKNQILLSEQQQKIYFFGKYLDLLFKQQQKITNMSWVRWCMPLNTAKAGSSLWVNCVYRSVDWVLHPSQCYQVRSPSIYICILKEILLFRLMYNHLLSLLQQQNYTHN